MLLYFAFILQEILFLLCIPYLCYIYVLLYVYNKFICIKYAFLSNVQNFYDVKFLLQKNYIFMIQIFMLYEKFSLYSFCRPFVW